MIWPPVRWRWLNRWYAKTLFYFWLPCPICGEPFGGQETLLGHVLWHSEHEGSCVCYKQACYLEAKRQSKVAGWFRRTERKKRV